MSHRRDLQNTCRCPTRLNNLPLSLAHRAVAKPPGVAEEAKDADLSPGAEHHLHGWVQPTPAAVIGDVGDDHDAQEMRADVASRAGVELNGRVLPN